METPPRQKDNDRIAACASDIFFWNERETFQTRASMETEGTRETAGVGKTDQRDIWKRESGVSPSFPAFM
jgi:hypothetical protein